MKATLLTLIFAFCAILGVSKFLDVTYNSEPYLTKSFDVEEPCELQIETPGGSIEVRGHDENTVYVEMYVKRKGMVIKADEKVSDDYEVQIEKEGRLVRAIVKPKAKGWFKDNNLSFSFKVSVPNQTSCDLSTSGGSVQVEEVKGEHKVSTSGGSLKFAHISGTMNAHTSGGSIKIEAFEGELKANTSGGSIKASASNGIIDLQTSGGSINLENLTGSIRANTSGGSINAEIAGLEKELLLSTSGGSIKATIPAGLGLDLDLKGNRVNTKLVNFNGETDKSRIVGTMNGGGIPVKLATSGGSVSLEYK